MKTTDFINESFVEDAAAAHQDHEVQMARGDCYNAAKYAIELHKLLKNVSEQEGLDGWVSEKITLANDYLRTVTEYLRYEQQSGSGSNMPDFDVRSATQTLDAALGESLLGGAEQKGTFKWYLKKGGELLHPYNSDKPYTFNSKEEAIAFAKSKYSTSWQKLIPTTYPVANVLKGTGKFGDPYAELPEGEEEPKQKRQPAVVKTNKPIGTRVADIGPGGKEYNVKTNKAWDNQHKEVDEERTVTRDETGKIIAWRDESEWRKVDKDKDGRGKVANLSDKARRETEKLQKDQGVAEGKADPVGSWVVYDDSKAKRFKTRDGAKAYAEKNGGKVASSEFYADNVQKQGVDEGSLNEFLDDRQGDDGEGISKIVSTTDRLLKQGYKVDLAVIGAMGRVYRADLDQTGFTPNGALAIKRKTKNFIRPFKIDDDDKYEFELVAPKHYKIVDSFTRSDDQGVAEDMSRAAKGHEKYGKEGMQALAKAGREGASEKTLDTIRDKHDKYKNVSETTSSSSVATSMGGGNGFANGGPGTIARSRMKKKK